MATNNRWSWRSRALRQDSTRALGAAQPALHLADSTDPMDGTARPVQRLTLPFTPAGMVDGSSSAEYNPRVAGRVDGAPQDHNVVIGHDQDAGTVAVRLQRAPRSTQGTTYETQRQVVEPTMYAGSRPALVRGDNALPENNPDGYSLGARNRRWVHRSMRPARLIHHDRPVPLHVATMSVDSEPPAGGGVYTSPVARLATRSRFTMSPLTRTPPAAPETLYAEAPTVGSVPYGAFVEGF